MAPPRRRLHPPLHRSLSPATLAQQTRAAGPMQLGSTNYSARVERLRRAGTEVAEFGQRALSQGCYGDDVAELQAFLAGQVRAMPVQLPRALSRRL